MTAPADDLDAGLDAGLETHPRTELAALLAGLWCVAFWTPAGAVVGLAVAFVVIVMLSRRPR